MSQAPRVEQDFATAVVAGDRRALARAITLVESANPDDIRQAGELISALLVKTGAAIRIGITGPPGAGKSTFIEAFGLHLVAQGKQWRCWPLILRRADRAVRF